MRTMRATFILCVLAIALTSFAVDSPQYDFTRLDTVLGVHGSFADDVCTYTLPRSDLHVAVEGMEIPSAAGLASVFHFFRCPCGKIRVVGQLCCCDYESNDVIDALRIGDAIRIAGVSPMLIGDKPHITLVLFQGEGDGEALAGVLRGAIRWIGTARMAAKK